jgi:hypothetical protein
VPIQLFSGITQFGEVLAGEEKHYFFQTSSKVDQYAILDPKSGNPDLYMDIISDLSLNKS